MGSLSGLEECNETFWSRFVVIFLSAISMEKLEFATFNHWKPAFWSQSDWLIGKLIPSLPPIIFSM